jgi:UDP-N-acetylmuramoyl-L-alanyl-D-glutamate--2,6-diaminopimelate ligase
MRNLVKRLIPKGLFAAIEPYGHLGEAILMNLLLGFPARGLKVIGVTGTDGKTTTSFYIYTMLKEAGYKVGLQTTVAYGAATVKPNQTHMTVVSSRQLLTRIKEMRKEGIEWLVLEVTSHSLAQHRVWGIPMQHGVWTNLSPEHLDYHKTFERYRAAKLRLARLVNRHSGVMIINADDGSAPQFIQVAKHSVTYGIEHGELRASEVSVAAAGSDYLAKYRDHALKIHTALPARFNVYNSLAAVGMGLILGLEDAQVEQGIAALTSVAGRMNRVDAGQEFGVVIDFAHTPQAFENVFRELRSLTPGRLIAVFGATGNRDKSKRPLMGEVAAKSCDFVVLTEDDDGTEDGLRIMDEVAAGAERAGKVREQDLLLIHDRRAAIGQAVRRAQPGDTIVLLGIGHQTTLNTNQGEVPWSEEQAAREAIADLA